MPEPFEHTAQLLVEPTGNDEHALTDLDPDIGHHPHNLGTGESLPHPLQRGGAEQRHNNLRLSKLHRHLIELRWLHSQDHHIGPLGKLIIGGNGLPANFGRKRQCPPRPCIRKQESFSLVLESTRHGSSHIASANEANIHGRQTSRAHEAGSGASPARGALFFARLPQRE